MYVVLAYCLMVLVITTINLISYETVINNNKVSGTYIEHNVHQLDV